MDFLKKLDKLDPELAAEARDELEDLEGQHRRELLKKQCDGRVNRAHRNLSDTINEFAGDMTGQDGEEEIESAARDYCDAQDEKIKRLDPDRYAELRAMGLL